MSVTEILHARDFPPCPRLRKRLFSQLLWSPGREPGRQTSQAVLHQIIQRAFDNPKSSIPSQVELNSQSQGTEGTEMLQTGRSLRLEGGTGSGTWSVPSDPQRNSLVIVFKSWRERWQRSRSQSISGFYADKNLLHHLESHFPCNTEALVPRAL